MKSYSLNSSFRVPLFGDINLGSDYQSGSLIISQPKNVVVQQNDRISQVVQDGQRSIVAVYDKKTAATKVAAGQLDLSSYYLVDEKIGEGLVLTNDGWVATLIDVSATDDFVMVDHGGKIYDIEKTLYDAATKYWFVKIKAHDLTAVQFAENADYEIGQLVIAINSRTASVVYISDPNFQTTDSLVRSSERLYQVVKVNNTSLGAGEFVFSLDGSVVGFYSEDGIVTPINYLKLLLPTVLKEEKISRPYLGVHYLNLYDYIGATELQGALLAKSNDSGAVEKNSPAALAGLQEGDIVLQVNGDSINKSNSFSKLILSKVAGENIELLVVRQNEDRRINLTLGLDK